MTDIAEKLRNAAYCLPAEGGWVERNGDTVPVNVCTQAADEIEALRKDAARYRWLRDNPWPSFLRSIVVTQSNAAWDTAIDASMKVQAERDAT